MTVFGRLSATASRPAARALAALALCVAQACGGGDDGTGPGQTGGTGTLLASGVPTAGVAGSEGSEKLYRIAVPAGATLLEVTTSGGTGDVDLYVRGGQEPTESTYDCSSEGADTIERCEVASPAAGDWYVRLLAYEAYSGVTLMARVTGGTGGTPGTTGYVLSSAATSVSVAQGQSASLVVTAARGSAFAEAIALSVEGLPSGVTAPNATIAAGATSAAITLTASATAAVGTGTITVRGRVTGQDDRTVAIPLTVTTAGGTSSTRFTIAAHPAQPLRITAGGEGVVTVVPTLTAGFGTTLQLSFEGLPSGVSAPAGSVGTGTPGVNLTVSASGAAATGRSTVTVRARSAGSPDATATFTLDVVPAVTVLGGATTLSVGTEGTHACAIRGGAAYCWGASTSETGGGWRGQGSVTTYEVRVPNAVAGGLSFASVSVSRRHSCALTPAGQAYCWGQNGLGQLGDGTTTTRTSPVAVQGGIAFASLAPSASSHSCGLTAAGRAYCWGYNGAGQLGDGTTTNRTAPVAVGGGLTFARLGVGTNHTCGITAAGAAYCWGDGSYMGNIVPPQTIVNATSPVPVLGGVKFAAIGAGHLLGGTCGITAAGHPHCWGERANLAMPGTALWTPAATPTSFAFASIAPGHRHSCGIDTDGAAYCWGENGSGQLGDGSTTGRTQPTAVSGGLRFKSVMPGDRFTCGETTGGEVYCWGEGGFFAMGNGGTTSSSVPVKPQLP